MEEEQPLLQIKPLISRGVMRKFRLRWANCIKADGRPPFLRHRRPSFRLSLCMRKAANHFRRKFQGKLHGLNPFYLNMGQGVSNFAYHHVNIPLGRSCFHHHTHSHGGVGSGRVGAPRHDDDEEEDISDSMALLHLQDRGHSDCHARHHEDGQLYSHPSFYEDGQFQPTANHTLCSEHLALQHFVHSNTIHLDGRARQSQGRVNRGLMSLASRKHSVPRDVPKGCVGVYVGSEQRRFIVPILHLNHPLFARLLECMDHDYQPGPLYIPCNVSEFQSLQSQVKKMSKRHRENH